MRTTITRRYAFEAAHMLPHVPVGHKCARMHGHNYEIEVTVSGDVSSKQDIGVEPIGFIVDFWTLDKLVDPLIEKIDHRTLNDIPGLENPTAENIGAWMLNQLCKGPPDVVVLWQVTGVRVFETKNCWADVTIPTHFD